MKSARAIVLLLHMSAIILRARLSRSLRVWGVRLRGAE
jgi:hypothetical protein